jgi:cytochrome b pre-mRNA-processing protein 3
MNVSMGQWEGGTALPLYRDCIGIAGDQYGSCLFPTRAGTSRTRPTLSMSAFMSLLKTLFGRQTPRDTLRPLYDSVVAEARQTHWYAQGGVPDTLDGRFDMVAAILSFVLLRMEALGAAEDSARLAEIFVDDMDGQLRQIGIGDLVVGKHIGRMMSALGGRLGAYRDALAGEADLEEALVRNLYRGEAPGPAAVAHVGVELRRFAGRLDTLDLAKLRAGTLS